MAQAIVRNPSLDCEKEHVQRTLNVAIRRENIDTQTMQRRLRLGYAAAETPDDLRPAQHCREEQ